MTKTIETLNIGEFISEGTSFTLLVQEISVRQTKAQKDYYSISFCDSTGTIEGNLWTIPPNLVGLADSFKESKSKEVPVFFKVVCEVVEYQEKKQLNIQKLIVLDSALFDVKEFLPQSRYSRQELWLALRDTVKSIDDEEYLNLINAVFNQDGNFYLESFLNHVAALRHHHNYIRGLAEHSLQVVNTALSVADQQFGFKALDKNLIKVGGLLHDIGKVEEYNIATGFQMNPYGVDHRYAGISIIDRVVREQKVNISPEKVKLVKNIIMSHHGEYGDQNVRYESPEAQLIHFCDNISAQMNKAFK